MQPLARLSGIEKMLKKFFMLALLFAAFPVQPRAQEQGFPWHLYELRTLREVVEENAAHATKYKDQGQLIFTKGRPYRARVTFTGESRPLPAERKELIELWVGTYGIDERYLKLFENEFLFKEGSDEHWLPVQTPVSKYFDKELRKGDEVEVYVQFVGGKREKGSDKTVWIFLMNEFQKPTQ